MKATEAQQADLLSLANLDQEISRSKAAIKNLSSGSQFSELRETQRNLAAKLINARNALDTVELDLKRSETDRELVEQRIAKDISRLNSTNNPQGCAGNPKRARVFEPTKVRPRGHRVGNLGAKGRSQRNLRNRGKRQERCRP
jgi:hypothetical protein